MGVLGRLTASVAEARSVGWARCEASVDEVLDALDDGQVEITPTRRGDGPIGLLRPLSREAAHRHSLSARFGYEVLPLHTDGAHLRTPPELVLLEACRPSSSGPTLLYHFSETDLARDVLSAFGMESSSLEPAAAPSTRMRTTRKGGCDSIRDA